MIDEITGAGRVGTRQVYEPARRGDDRKQREKKKFASLYHREAPSIGSQRSDKAISPALSEPPCPTLFVHDEQLISQHCTLDELTVNGVALTLGVLAVLIGLPVVSSESQRLGPELLQLQRAAK